MNQQNAPSFAQGISALRMPSGRAVSQEKPPGQLPVPADLQAVLNAANIIKPVSSTGQPTVAAQVLQKAGMAQIAQDTRTAAPLVNQRMQDEQIQAQLARANAAASMPAGIEGLRTGIAGYADGGIVGFQTGGFAPDYQDARRFGIDLSPYDSPEARAEKIDRMRKMREFEAQMAGNRAEIPTEASQAAEQGIARAYADPTRMRDIPPVVQAMTQPAPAPRPTGPARPTGTPRPAATPAPAPAAGIATLTDLDKKYAESLDELERQRKTPFAGQAPTLEAEQAITDKARQAQGLAGIPGAQIVEQIAAYKARIAQQDAERAAGRKGRSVTDLIEALSAGASGGLGSVGAKYAAGRKAREEQEERLRQQKLTQEQAVFTMQNAQVAMQEAAAIGNRNAYTAAEKAFNDAKRAYETNQISTLLAITKERGDLAKTMAERPLKERQVKAQETQAQAAMLGAQNRGVVATELNPYQRAQLREKAADNVRQDKNLPTIIFRAKQEAAKNRVPFDEQQFIETLIQRQYDLLIGKAPAEPAAGGQKVYDFMSIGGPK